MVLIGIDFSINSTGICISDGKSYSWVNVCTNLNNKRFNELNRVVTFLNRERQVPKNNYRKEQKYKLEDSVFTAEMICSFLKEQTKGKGEVFVAFEGFSFASKGKSFIDLISYNSILRSYLFQHFTQNIYIFSPSQIKKNLTGKGNSNKLKMFESFLTTKDSVLRKDLFFKYCFDLKIKDKIPKPIDDLVDAYSILKCLEATLLKEK